MFHPAAVLGAVEARLHPPSLAARLSVDGALVHELPSRTNCFFVSETAIPSELP